MQLRNVLTSFIFALCCADLVLGQQAVRRRQDGGNNATPAPTTSSVQSTGDTPSTSQQSSETSAQSSATTTSTGNASKITSSTTLAGGVVSVTTHQTPTPTAEAKKDKLPIQPSITPAVGIAGAILLISGFAYGIIGIKHQWFLVFFSSAYLASLAVTVLVIYVMNPPVSDAIQGAYFVAALMTGVIFGGISLVFKEVTEGLGCLLGGFCLAMWFLVLKPGGLIDSTTGKAIMIGVFAAVGWSLSFSQYTRNYGLIFCSAFSGATICVIGIDCFSRAGLKEFWIYIWALNNDEFPIGTHTYPITRGIRVEIAANIILFLFGLMSQMKIWKIVKERRDRKDAQRLEDEERRDQRDSRIGRKVEANNERSLAQWEAVYGDKDVAKVQVDSGVGTSVDSFKGSTSVTEREMPSIEMDDMGNTQKRASKISHARVASDEEALRAPELQQLDFDNENAGSSWWADYQSNKSSKTPSKRASVSTIEEIHPNGMPVRKAPGPPVVPLPFVPPVENDEDAKSQNGSVGSDGTAPLAVHERRGVSLNKLSLRKHDKEVPPAPLPRIDDDVASSVAATDNDNMSTKRLSVMPSPYALSFNGGNSPFSDEFAEKPPMSSAPQTPGEMPIVENDDEELVRPTTAAKGENVTDFFAMNRDSKKAKRKSTPRDDDGEKSDGEVSVVASLKGDKLPDSISKVAMAYRTNEWAKHIADADQPDIEEEQDPEEAPVRVDVGRPEETPRPVDTVALSPTAEPVKSPKSPTNPYRKASATPVYSSQSQRKASNPSLQRASSAASMTQQKLSRTSSAPLAPPTLVESPVEEDLASPYRNFTSPIPSTNNLLDERSRLVQTKPSTTSFAGLSPPPLDTAAAVAVANGPPSPMIPEENIPLSQRKSLIQQGTLSPTSPPEIQRRSSRQRTPEPSRTLSRTQSSSHQNLIYDSHQPRRASTVDTKKQSAMLTQWRQSLQQENYANQPAMMAEQQRMSMIGQLQQKNYRDQKAEAAREKRESKIDMAMRTGQLTNAHQNALRKMQAKANESAK